MKEGAKPSSAGADESQYPDRSEVQKFPSTCRPPKSVKGKLCVCKIIIYRIYSHAPNFIMYSRIHRDPDKLKKILLNSQTQRK